MEWINRKKELPKQWQEIIMYFPEYNGTKDFMAMTLYSKEMEKWSFTHWTPKPKPPK